MNTVSNSSPGVAVVNPPVISQASYSVSTGILTLTGKYFSTIANNYLLTALTLTGDSGNHYTLSSSSTISATSTTQIKILLSAADQLSIETVFDKNGLVANDAVTHYSLTAASNWLPKASATLLKSVTVSNVLSASLSAASYNEATGVFTLSGNHLTDHSNSIAMLLNKFKLVSGNSSFSLNNTDNVSQLNNTSFNITLSSADKATVNSLLTNSTVSSYLSLAAQWDDNSGLAISKQALTIQAMPTLSSASYNAATGILQLNGSNLSTNINVYNLTDFSIKGDAKTSYSLTAASVIADLNSSSSVFIQCSAADQFALAGLLNQNGSQASDNATYALTANAGWLSYAKSISSIAINTGNVQTPSISSVNYNANTGAFTVTGSALSNLANSNGIVVTAFTLSAGSSSYHFTANDVISQQSASGFTIILSSADQALVNAFINADGMQSNTGLAYTFSATSNWDNHNTGLAISNQSINVYGVSPVNSLAVIASLGLFQPSGITLDSAGDLFIADAYNNAIKEIAAGSNTLTTVYSSGLFNPTDVRVDSLGNIFIADAGNNAIKEIVAGSKTAITIATTGLNFPAGITLDSQDDIFVANSNANSIDLMLNPPSYTIYPIVSTGLYFPGDITSDTAGNVYIVDSGNNAIKELSGSSTLITLVTMGLNDPGAIAVDSQGNLFVANDGNSQIIEWVASTHAIISLLTTGLNTPEGLVVDSQGNLYIADSFNGEIKVLSLASVTTVSAVDYNATNGQLTLIGNNLLSTGGVINLADFSITGDKGETYSLTHSVVTRLSNNNSVMIQLSASDQLAINGLLNQNGTTAADKTTDYSLAVSANWNGNAPSFVNQSIVVDSVKEPTITAVSYNASTGVFYFTGNNLTNHGNSSGINVNEFSLTVAAKSYTFSANDKVSALTATGFLLTLSNNDRATVNAIVNNTGLMASNGSAYTLSSNSVWDGNNSNSFNLPTVTAFNAKTPITVTAVNYNATTGVLSLTGSNFNTSSSAYRLSDVTLSGDAASNYSLSNTSTLMPISTASKLNIQLSATDELAVNGLLNKNGMLANDSLSAYTLNTSVGWLSGAAAISQTLTVSNSNSPILITVTYDEATGILSVTGNNFVNHGNTLGINPASFSLSNGQNANFNLSANDSVSQLTANAFSIQLSNTEQSQLSSLFSTNGKGLNNNLSYSLAANALWDSDNGTAIKQLALTVTNAQVQVIVSTGVHYPDSIALDSQGDLFIADANDNSLKELPFGSQALLNLASSGLSYPGGLSLDSQGNIYFLSASATQPVLEYSNSHLTRLPITQAQVLAVDSLGDLFIINNNKLQEMATGVTTLTTLISTGLNNASTMVFDSLGNLYIADSGDHAIKELPVGSQALINLISTGLKNPTGLAVDSLGDVYIADSLNNTIVELIANCQTLVSLLSTGLNQPESLALDSNGHLFIADSNNNDIKVLNVPTNSPVLTSANYNASTGVLSLTGTGLSTLASNYQFSDFTFTGNGNLNYTLSTASIWVSPPNNAHLTIQLSTTDQVSVDALLNNNGSDANDGTPYQLLANLGWENGANPQLLTNVTVSQVVMPSLSTVSYNPIAGELTVTGNHLLSVLAGSGINLNDLSLAIGSVQLPLNNKDTVFDLTGNGFNISLTAAQQSSVNSLLNASDSANPTNAVNFNLNTSINWDNNTGSALTAQAITLAQPTVTAINAASVVDGAKISASNLVAAYRDSNALAVTEYAFRDDGSTGYFSLNSSQPTNGNWLVVSASNLNQLSYKSNATGTDTLDIMAFNGYVWSAISSTQITSLSQAPILADLTDAGIRADVSSQLVNDTLSYSGMLKILNDVATAIGPSGRVTASEFADLQTLVAHFTTTGSGVFASNQILVSPYIYDISNKLINGDSANNFWTGGSQTPVTLGNLAVGSSQTVLNELIGKWFLGTDLPSPVLDNASTNGTQTGTYKADSVSLYGATNAPVITDINQNQLGDCYFLASLGEVAKCEPQVIESMITNDGNGIYGIRFYLEGVATYITVNNVLPYSGKDLLANQSSDLWACLIEKAYVQLNAEPGATGNGHTVGNQWNLIDGGEADPLIQITNRSVAEFDSTKINANDWVALKSTLISALQSNEEVILGTNGNASSGGKQTFISDHMFEVVSYNSQNGQFLLENPWGTVSGQTWYTTFYATLAQMQTIAKGQIYIATNGNTPPATYTSLFMPTVTSDKPQVADVYLVSSQQAVVVNNFQAGAGQIELPTAQFSAFAGQTVVNAENFSNANTATSSIDYLYYQASTGEVFYAANGNASSAIEIAVIGVNNHPEALAANDFRLI